MIQNNLQLSITKNWITEFEKSLEELHKEQILLDLRKAAVLSEIDTLKKQVYDYENSVEY